MKKNLTKILAIAAMAFTVSACSGKKSSSESSSSSEEVQTVTIDQVLTLGADYNWELEGKLVKVENLVLQGRYGNNFIGGAAISDYVTGLRGLEIDCTTSPTFTGSGYGADITAQGRVTNVNGRAVLKDATVTVNSERVYNEEGTSYTGGLPLYYWGSMTRSAWDTYIGRSMSGIVFGADMQIASLPTFETGKDATFQVVFPGEDTDTTDPDNMSLINVTIPGTVSEAGVSAATTFFAEYAAKDYFNITGITQYDLASNGGAGILLENFWSQIGLDEVSETPNVCTTWAEVAALAQGYYKDEMVEISNENIISYVPDLSYIEDSVDDLFSDPSFITIEDHTCASFLDLVINAKSSKLEETYEAICASFETAGGTETSMSSKDDGEAIYEFKDASNHVYANIVLMLGDTSMEAYYIAEKPSKSFDTFADAKAYLESRSTAYEQSLNSEATARTSALVDCTYAAPVSYKVVYTNEASYSSYYSTYGLLAEYEVTMELPAYTSEQSDEGAVAAYEAQLEAAGFTYVNFQLFQADGWYNNATHEFVVVDCSDGVLDLDVLELDATSGSLMAARSDALYIGYMKSMLTRYGTAYSAYWPKGTDITFFDSFTVGEASAVDWDYSSSTAYASYSILLFTFDVYYADGTDFDAVTTGLVSQLTAAGYVEMANPVFYQETAGDWVGYADTTNGLWVAVDNYGASYGCVEVTVMASKNYFKA